MINTADQAVVATIPNTVTDTIQLSTASPVDTGPNGLAITPDGSRVYTADRFANDVDVSHADSDIIVSARDCTTARPARPCVAGAGVRAV